jgi:hypothetical protein|tara:strand:+ start:248 stop:670 length:423 start_codon:yes stop_codon:yes gene_type:complete
MPKSLVSKKKLFRDFSHLNQRYVKNNYLKRLRTTMMSFCDKRDIFEREMLFMLWCYDLEFFTLKYAAKDYEYSEKKLAERLVYPLVKEGYLYKHFDKMTPSNTLEDHLFREETKYNYRVRYALSQRGRLLVQAFYKKLNS